MHCIRIILIILGENYHNVSITEAITNGAFALLMLLITMADVDTLNNRFDCFSTVLLFDSFYVLE